jgi:hypothetical protein
MRRLLLITIALSACGKTKQPPPCDGWSASKTQRWASEFLKTTASCKAGVPVLTTEVMTGGSEDSGEEKTTRKLSREAWSSLWSQLDAAKWRELAAECPKSGAVESDQMPLAIDFEISDGKTSKKVSCDSFHLGAQHRTISDAMDGLGDATTDVARRSR